MVLEIKSSKGRLYVETEHGEAELLYRIEGNVLEVYHIFTPPEDRGQGIAESLAKEVVEFAKKNGMKIIPKCDYMKAFFNKHKELKAYEVIA